MELDKKRFSVIVDNPYLNISDIEIVPEEEYNTVSFEIRAYSEIPVKDLEQLLRFVGELGKEYSKLGRAVKDKKTGEYFIRHQKWRLTLEYIGEEKERWEKWETL